MSARLQAGHDQKRKTCLWISPKTCFACQAYPTHTAAGRGWFAGLGARWPNMLPLYDFKHPRSPPKRGGELDIIHGHEHVMASGRPDP
jgi:hypothetical protein